MARTKGSGWGGGPILYQACNCCGKKKAYFDPLNDPSISHWKPFRCTSCKERFDSNVLIKKTHK